MTEHPGRALRRLRIQRKWSQDECATRLGTTRYSVNQLENERRAITVDMARRLAHEFPEHSALGWLILQARHDLARYERNDP